MVGSITVKNTVIGEGIPAVCVPLTGATLPQLMTEAREAAAAGPDLVEWRADLFEGIFRMREVEEALKVLCDLCGDVPLIVTIRTEKEGGELKISLKDYVEILKKTAATGLPSLIDVEALQLDIHEQREIAEAIHQAGMWMIGSSHHFGCTPSEEEMKEIFRREEEAGADLLKLAVMPQDYGDLARLLTVTAQMRDGCERPVITMSMGEIGSASRFCGEIFGSAVTFAAVGKASAPGQLPIDELRQLLAVFHGSV